MSKVYLYSRVSTNQQTLEQQERTVYEWLKLHNMHVDEVVSDCGISGGVSYADRDLGKVLLPKMQAGDMLIVSEISRLGRSMFDLSKLIHTELKPRKLRLVVCNMSIDLRCDKLTAIDELILNNFSFAAQLEKQLISERTLSALDVKRKQGVKFGASNEVYRINYEKKSKEQKKREGMKRGQTKSSRFVESKDVQAFLKILKRIFQDACITEDPAEWNWKQIGTRGDNCQRIIELMGDYKSMDDNGTLFDRWKFCKWTEEEYQLKLCAIIYHIKRTFKTMSSNRNKISDNEQL